MRFGHFAFSQTVSNRSSSSSREVKWFALPLGTSRLSHFGKRCRDDGAAESACDEFRIGRSAEEEACNGGGPRSSRFGEGGDVRFGDGREKSGSRERLLALHHNITADARARR